MGERVGKRAGLWGIVGLLLALGIVPAEAQAGHRSAGQRVAQLSVGAAGILPSASAPLDPTGIAAPLPGWTTFCSGNPAECAVKGSDPDFIPLTAKAWQALVAVNRRVNGLIEPMTDSDHWGVNDRWDLPADGAGDCEDYQLLKRKLLVAQGFPARALRMTVVIDETGEGHAVLMARTSRGDFILDNKQNSVLPWQQTGYVFVKREGADGRDWVSLGRAAGPTATANR